MRRGIAWSTLALMLIAVVSFIAVSYTVSRAVEKAPAALQEEICRAAVLIRQKIGGTSPMGAGATVPIEVACKTITLDVPVKNTADRTTEGVEKQLADRVARCWYMYGEGVVKDVFAGDPLFADKCAVCYAIDVKEWENGRQEKITSTEFSQYLWNTPYIVRSGSDRCKQLGGTCTDEKREGKDLAWYRYEINNEVCREKEKTYCEYSDYECLNKGGTCSSSPVVGMQPYQQWKCPQSLQCYVQNEQYFSYYNYVQFYEGEGVINVLSDIMPGESYAIAFGSPTQSCATCERGVLGGFVATAAGLGLMGSGAVASATGWGAIIGVPAIGVGKVLLVGGVTTTILSLSGKEGADLVYQKLLKNRPTGTVYVGTLDQITKGNVCRVIGNE